MRAGKLSSSFPPTPSSKPSPRSSGSWNGVRATWVDHADGLAERLTQLREQESELMVQFMTSVMEEIELTDEQRAKLEPAMQRQLRVVNGEHDRDRSRHRHGDRCR